MCHTMSKTKIETQSIRQRKAQEAHLLNKTREQLVMMGEGPGAVGGAVPGKVEVEVMI